MRRGDWALAAILGVLFFAMVAVLPNAYGVAPPGFVDTRQHCSGVLGTANSDPRRADCFGGPVATDWLATPATWLAILLGVSITLIAIGWYVSRRRRDSRDIQRR